MFKCYRQIESSDCGLTCIRMIARSYGVKIPTRHLKEITDLNRLGMSLRDLTGCLHQIGMDSAAARIRTEDIERMPLPAILYWQQRHFVVLYKFNPKRKRYSIADPAQGKLTYNEDEFKKYWIPEGQNTGLAVLAEPKDDFYRRQYRKENEFKRFFTYISGFLKTIVR